MTQKRKQLIAQAKESIREIKRLATSYRYGIETLERVTQADMSVAAVHEWFRLYLRIVDIGVQIRRGEIRHRTKSSTSYSCLHKTGTKGATHSGISIDDVNSAYRMLENKGMNEDHLEQLFLGVDELDRDYVGGMDKQLVQCLNTLLRHQSTAYVRLELTGTDPHQALVVVAAQSLHPLPPITRKCFSPDSCFCPEDAEPWVDFVLPTHEKSSNDAGFSVTKDVFVRATTQKKSIEAEEVGIIELKRKFGFEPEPIDVNGGENDGESAIPKRKRIFVRNRVSASGNVLQSMNTTTSVVQRLAPVEIYQQHCQQIGSTPQAHMRHMFAVESGALQLKYEGLVLPTQNDIQTILHVINVAQLPVQSINVANTFLNIQAFDGFCEWVRCHIVRLHLEELNLRSLGLPQRKSYFGLLEILADPQLGELGQLKYLDVSFWNFTQDVTQALTKLLHLPQLKSVEELSIMSCFAKGHDVLEYSVDSLFSACSNCLKTLDVSANCISVRNLNSLFGAKSSLKVIRMKNMVVVPFGDAQDTTAWDLSQLLILKFSETYDSIMSAIRQTATATIVRALISSFSRRVMRIKYVDLVIHEKVESSPAIPILSSSLDDSTSESMLTLFGVLLLRIQEYGKLQSLSLRFVLPIGYIMLPAIEHAQLYSSLGRLLSDGLLECEVLELCLGIPLTLRRFRTLVVSSHLPNVRILRLSILLKNAGQDDLTNLQESEMSFVDFFRTARKLRDVVLEWIVPIHSSSMLLPTEIFDELEKAWKSQSLKYSSSDQPNQPKVQYNTNLTKKRILAKVPDAQDMEKTTMYFSVA